MRGSWRPVPNDGGPRGPVPPPRTPSVFAACLWSQQRRVHRKEVPVPPESVRVAVGGAGRGAWLGGAGGWPVRGPGAQYQLETEMLCRGWWGAHRLRPGRLRACGCCWLSLCLLISTLLLDTLSSRQMGPDAQLTSGEEFFIFKRVKGKNHLETPPRPLNGDAPPGASSFP